MQAELAIDTIEASSICQNAFAERVWRKSLNSIIKTIKLNQIFLKII